MRPLPRPLLTSLRRFRGAWVLAVAALLLKVLSSSFCVADGLRASVATYGNQHDSTAQMVDVTAASSNNDAGDCLLGEGGSCHCACAHALPLPAVATVAIMPPLAPIDFPALPPANLSKPVASLLRPPIA